MPMTPAAAAKLAERLIGQHDRALQRDAHLGKVSRYLAGEHDLPYMPRGAKAEYQILAKRSVTNWLPLISDTFTKGLFVDGYRAAKAPDNAKPWDYWQANGLDARQTIAHRGALDYGTGWVLVLKGKPAPLIRPLSPKRVAALYEDPDDEWPTYALVRKGRTENDGRIFDLYDGEAVYTVVDPKDSTEPIVTRSVALHGLGVCPLVRFRDRLDGDARGIIAPLITLQDRINEAVFSLLVALQFASFRQRWATGLAIPVDEDEFLDANGTPTQVDTGTRNPNYGKPVEEFKAAVDRLWVTDSPDARFGDFAQTEVSGHLNAYSSAVKSLAAIAQTPPHVLLGDLVNLSADALAAAESQTQRKIGEYETIFGEAWEQVFRLAALAAGDVIAARDTSAQVRWRDTEARSLASTVDALGKITQMLQVPPEELWSRIPGVTDIDVQRWKATASRSDGMAALAAALNRQQQPGAGAPQNPQAGAGAPSTGSPAPSPTSAPPGA